jgi:hypothetical protein
MKPLARIGAARLEPFDPSWITQYPVFKDPSKDFEPGTNLCRMGFPQKSTDGPRFIGSPDV